MEGMSGDSPKASRGYKSLDVARPKDAKRLNRRTLFLETCREIWRKGEVSEEENRLLNRLRKFLRLDKDLARRLAKTAKAEFKAGKLAPGEGLQPGLLYRKICERAWADAVLDAHEQQMLEGLAALLELDPQDAEDIQERARSWSEQRLSQSSDAPSVDMSTFEGQDSESIGDARRDELAQSSGGLMTWRRVEGGAGRPQTLWDSVGRGPGAACMAVVWLAVLALTYLFVVPAQEVTGVVQRRRVEAREGLAGKRFRLTFWVRGKAYRTRQPGLLRYLRPGDRLRLLVRDLWGVGPYLQEVRQLRTRPRGYLYEDHSYLVALGGLTLVVLSSLVGFGFAVRRVGRLLAAEEAARVEEGKQDLRDQVEAAGGGAEGSSRDQEAGEDPS